MIIFDRLKEARPCQARPCFVHTQKIPLATSTNIIGFYLCMVGQNQWQHQEGGGGAWEAVSSSQRFCPTCPPVRRKMAKISHFWQIFGFKKNGQNQLFLANLLIFAPSELHFAPSMPPPNISAAATGQNNK